MAGRDPGYLGLRGPIIAQDLDLPDSRQSGSDARRTRQPGFTVPWTGGTSPLLALPIWAQPSPDPDPSPEQALLTKELRGRLATVIDTLPPNMKIVLWLRDVEGWSSDDVCNALAIQETNQRVLLHRARSRAREALEPYLEGARGAARRG